MILTMKFRITFQTHTTPQILKSTVCYKIRKLTVLSLNTQSLPLSLLTLDYLLMNYGLITVTWCYKLSRNLVYR